MRSSPSASVAAEGLDLLVLPTEIDVAAMIDGFLEMTTLPARPVSPDVDMPFVAWIGMLAAADVRRRAALEAELEHRRSDGATFTAADLESRLRAGLTHNDTRWAVTAFTPISPVGYRMEPPAGPDMARELERAGLARAGTDDRLELTEVGEDVAALFTGVIVWGAVTIVSPRSDPAVRIGELSIVRTPLRLGFGFWNGEGGAFSVTLLEPEPDAGVEMIRRMLLIPIPADVPAGTAPTCPSCGEATTEGQRFCSSCGAALQVIAPTRIVACPVCGAEVDLERGRFCAQCGTAVPVPGTGVAT